MGHVIQFVVGFALLLHVLFWGAGAALLVMPKPWRRFWPVLIAPAGFALQSVVVWIGVYAGGHGTNAYAWATELVPIVLFIAGAQRLGPRRLKTDLGRFGLVWLLMGGCLALQIAPLAWASKGLTTTSLGSCDAADYAAGARVFMEFAHGDRTGFLGLTEVVRTGSADNFFDFWLRLNHFSPSALIAFNGTILHCAPHELTGLMTMVLFAGTLPVAFWMARALLGYSGAASLVVALIFALSPIEWYAVGHVAMSQLLGAIAIGLITWPAVTLWRRRLSRRRAWQFSGVLLVGFGLLLGSYNFMLVICLVPAVAFAGGWALWRGQWRRLAGWAAAVLAPLIVAAAFFWPRVAVLPERFALFRRFDFGWRIPALTPEGWLGMVSGPALEPWSIFGLRWLLAAMVGLPLAWALARAVKRNHPDAWLVVALTAPILAGYALLGSRGVRPGSNASYDAYKLFVVFYPLLLPAFCWWLTLRRSRRLWEWLAVVALASVVIAFNVVATGMFIWQMARPPLIVDGELRQLRKIETMPDVASVNVMIRDLWPRLWANAFLLRKPQYFPVDSYEARWHTPLRGDWDLDGGLFAVSPAPEARRPISIHYALVDRRSRGFLRADFGAGWNNEEQDPGTAEHWRWTKRRATIRIDNPHPYPLTIACAIDGWSLGEGGWALALDVPPGAPGLQVTEAEVLGQQRRRTEFNELTIPSGTSTLSLWSPDPTQNTTLAGDPRELGVCVFRFEIAVKETAEGR